MWAPANRTAAPAPISSSFNNPSRQKYKREPQSSHVVSSSCPFRIVRCRPVAALCGARYLRHTGAYESVPSECVRVDAGHLSLLYLDTARLLSGGAEKFSQWYCGCPTGQNSLRYMAKCKLYFGTDRIDLFLGCSAIYPRRIIASRGAASQDTLGALPTF